MPDLTRSARLNFGVFVATLILAVISVSTRFIIRFKLRQRILAADLMCLLATCFFITYGTLITNFIFNTSLYHALDANPLLGLEELINLSKMSFIAEIIFGCGITSIKLSILWLYNHLFSTNKRTQRAIHAVGAVAVIWFIVVTFVIIFQCKPISAYWETVSSTEFCTENTKVLLGYEMTNLFIDVAILCIPMSVLPRLQIATSKKIPVVLVFLLGALVCIFSIFRLVAIYRLPNVTANFDFTFVFFWATLELGMAIVLSCLPTLGPVLTSIPNPLTYAVALFDSFKSRMSRSTTRTNPVSQYSASQEESGVNQRHQWVKVDNHSARQQNWEASGGRDDGSEYPLQPVEPRSIMVSRDYEVV